MAKGRKRLTLETDPDRATLLDMERSIQKGERAGGHDAASSFAGPTGQPAYDANLRRLYRKYRKYREELSALVREEGGLNVETIGFERLLAEAIAGKSPKQKIEFLARYLEITRDQNAVFNGVRARFFSRGKSLVKEELTELLTILGHIANIEMEQAGISARIREFGQKLADSGREVAISDALEDSTD